MAEPYRPVAVLSDGEHAPADWDQLISTLTLAYQAQRHTALYIRRGGPPTRKPAGGHPPALSLAEQTLVTVLRLRFQTPRATLPGLTACAQGHGLVLSPKARPAG
ncbi:MAG: hypothetical protein ACLQDY_16080 [Streptosporangiaceae bacterium]